MKRFQVFLIILFSGFIPLFVTAQPAVTKERMTIRINEPVRAQVESGKMNRTKAESKMSSQVLEIRAQHKAFGGTFAPKGIQPQSLGQLSLAQVDLKERVHLYLYISKMQPVPALVKKIKAKHIIVSGWNKDVPIIQVWATVPQLDALAKMSEVHTIDLVVPPAHSAGPVLSEGVSRVHADVAQTVMGANGAGIKVGVLSDDCGTVEGLIAPRVANGELTFNPVIIDDTWGGARSHEGLAMMEIVQDVAPLAQLYYATAFTGYTNFVNNVQALATAGCKVITDDIIYFNEPVFEDGALSAKIDAVAAANGVIYTSAAINEAQYTWTGTYADHALLQNIGNTGGGPFHVCDYIGTTFLNGLSVGSNVTITLHWDDQFGNSRNDYDLFVVNAANNNTVASSTSVQKDANPGNPYEQCSVAAGTYNIIIRRTSTSIIDPNPNARLKLTCWQAPMAIVNGIGSTFGHPTATNALGCGAIGSNRTNAIGSENNYNTIEPYSSQGPCKIINFAGGLVGGNRPVSVQRLKPDVASMDGVSTSVAGFQPFYGTSAAAPHTAGIAADLASLYPTISANAAQTAIRNGCIDYGAAGADNIYGYGRTDAFRTIALYRQLISPSTYAANFTSPDVTITDNTPAGITSSLLLSPTCNGINPTSLYVSVTVDGHNRIGDLKYTLTSPDNTTIILMNRPVNGAGTATGKNPNIVFGDAASNPIQTTNPVGSEEVGFYIPSAAISAAGFNGHSLGGTWVLTASDNAAGSTGILKDWGIYAVEGTSPTPTLTINWNPPFIYPNNHALETISVTNSLSGGCSPNVVLQSLTSNEPDITADPGDVAGDIQGATTGVNTQSFQLRSECLSTGKGRFYTATYRVTDVGGYVHDTIFPIPVLCTPGRVDPSADIPFGGLTLDRAPSPDPLFTSSNISYTIPGPSNAEVMLTICNNLGKWVKNFDYGIKAPGTYTLSWNASAADGSILPNGVYAYQLSVGAPYNALKTGVVIVNRP